MRVEESLQGVEVLGVDNDMGGPVATPSDRAERLQAGIDWLTELANNHEVGCVHVPQLRLVRKRRDGGSRSAELLD
jgi:hypothetical protein